MISPAQPAFAVGLATKSTHILYCLITQLLLTSINATNNTVQAVTQQWRSGESPPITPFVMYAAVQQPGRWRRLQLPTQSPQNKETLFQDFYTARPRAGGVMLPDCWYLSHCLRKCFEKA
jgi:hypothetical protein